MASNNSTEVHLADGRIVCLSYGVPVAAFIPGRGYLKTDRRWSTTTSRHMNAFAGHSATEVPDKEFCQLISPLETKR